jgi:hypothetical protein
MLFSEMELLTIAISMQIGYRSVFKFFLLAGFGPPAFFLRVIQLIQQ